MGNHGSPIGEIYGYGRNAPLVCMLKNPLLGWYEIKFSYLIKFMMNFVEN